MLVTNGDVGRSGVGRTLELQTSSAASPQGGPAAAQGGALRGRLTILPAKTDDGASLRARISALPPTKDIGAGLPGRPATKDIGAGLPGSSTQRPERTTFKSLAPRRSGMGARLVDPGFHPYQPEAPAPQAPSEAKVAKPPPTRKVMDDASLQHLLGELEPDLLHRIRDVSRLLHDIFKDSDSDGDGYITRLEMRCIFLRLGEMVSIEAEQALPSEEPEGENAKIDIKRFITTVLRVSSKAHTGAAVLARLASASHPNSSRREEGSDRKAPLHQSSPTTARGQGGIADLPALPALPPPRRSSFLHSMHPRLDGAAEAFGGGRQQGQQLTRSRTARLPAEVARGSLESVPTSIHPSSLASLLEE